MHARPPAADETKRAKRERRKLAQQRYRQRFDAGRFTITVEIDGAVVEMLIASRWLDAECIDRKKIALALSAMLSDAAAKR